jgi:hypothetical protein
MRTPMLRTPMNPLSTTRDAGAHCPLPFSRRI